MEPKHRGSEKDAFLRHFQLRFRGSSARVSKAKQSLKKTLQSILMKIPQYFLWRTKAATWHTTSPCAPRWICTDSSMDSGQEEEKYHIAPYHVKLELFLRYRHLLMWSHNVVCEKGESMSRKRKSTSECEYQGPNFNMNLFPLGLRGSLCICDIAYWTYPCGTCLRDEFSSDR